MRPLLALLALAFLAPVASAQVPDPAPVVDEACALLPGDVSDALPLCPRQEPAVPVEPHAEAHKAPAPPPPANPEDATQLADAVKGQAEGAVEDPASAPDRLASIAAAIVQFVKDLLGLPRQVGDALTDAAAKVGETFSAATKAAGERIGQARAFVASLWDALPQRAGPVEQPKAPRASDVQKTTASLVDGALKTVGVPART